MKFKIYDFVKLNFLDESDILYGIVEEVSDETTRGKIRLIEGNLYWLDDLCTYPADSISKMLYF